MRLSGRKLLVWTAAVALASGGSILTVRLLAAPVDDFSTTRHPAEPWLLAAHRWIAPATVLAIGWTIGEHAEPKRRARNPNVGSGAAVIAFGILTVLSATALQSLDLGGLRPAAIWLHAAFAFAAGLLTYIHARRASRNCVPAQRESGSSAAGPQGQQRMP